MTTLHLAVARGLVTLLLAFVATVAHAQVAAAPPSAPAAAQGAAQAGPPPLRIFLDCQYECDTEYLRRAVTFVDYVRDRGVADLHVLVTTQSTGAGGSAWIVKFIGLQRFLGLDRTLTFTTSPTATSDERRREFGRIFKLGLVAYAADTPVAPKLDVTYRSPQQKPGASVIVRDPWHRWVFRTNASASMSGEASTEYGSYRLNLSGSRVTPDWKVNLSAGTSYNENTFDLGDGEVIKSITESSNVNALVVKSLTGKWSWGNAGSISNSSFANTARAVSGSTGIEYDFFPYVESNRRSLTLTYRVGLSNYKYREPTVYDKLEETIPNHSITMSLGLRQPWGSVGASSSFNQHLNHTDRFRSSTNGNADVRVFKGFSLYAYAGYSKIKDQVALRKGAATPEEILLRLEQQATNYSFNYSFGFSYSFGSIFTSIVNPRFGGVFD
ncbi:MAG TPA: hypothetical protein VMS54_11825 [Vicinamibacterales bacterium]|nr:hypothetical protein [Vicinamibacterales bacterium]